VLRALVVTDTDANADAKTDMDVDTADPEVVARFDQAVEDLRQAGAVIIDPFRIPDLLATDCSRDGGVAHLGPLE
jgi:Asp-tRNA(Asn)/Glu-tRNA(Gln) amidotransferase A subunit family amidase